MERHLTGIKLVSVIHRGFSPEEGSWVGNGQFIFTDVDIKLSHPL